MSPRARVGSSGLLVLAAFVYFAPRAARGDEPARARLAYAHEPSVAGCPSDRELRDAVSARLGYDPFASARDDEPMQILVQVRRRGAAVAGTLEIMGPRPGKKELDSPRGDCRELVDALAVAIALAIDPASSTRPPPPPPPAPPPPPPAPPPEPVVPLEPPPPPVDRPAPPEAPARAPIVLSAGVSGRLYANELPSFAAGGGVHLGARWKAFEPRLEGLFSLLGSTGNPSGPGTVQASLLAATILPCGHVGIGYACGGLTLGAMRAEGLDVAIPRRQSDLYATATIRAGVVIPLTQGIDLDGAVDLVVPLRRIALELDGREVFRSPSAGLRVSLGPSFRFW